MTETFYDVLGVPETADSEAIEAAYREAIKEVHPDVSDDVDAGERTKRLNKAKRVLTDEDERARYDRLGHDAYTGGPADANGADSGSGSDGRARGSSGSWTREAARSATEGSGSDGRSGPSGSNGSTWRGRQSTRGRRSGTDRERADRRSAEARSTGAEGSAGPDGTADDSRQAGDSRQGGSNGATADGATASGASEGTGTVGGGAATGGDTVGGATRSRSAGESTGTGQSARRQAVAGRSDGSNVEQSWNAWESTRSWSVRQGGDAGRGFGLGTLLGPDQSLLLFASTFFLYPFFVASTLFPLFPLTVRAVVAVCTVLMFAYLLSVPGIAIAVFGTWSLVFPVVLVALPGVSLLSLAGVVGLVTTWVPLGLSVLTLAVLRS